MTVMWDEELKLAFGLWIQTYCPITTKGQLLQFYGPCNLIDGISILIYSLLSRKVKWHSKNKQLPNYWCLYVYATGWISYCQFYTINLHSTCYETRKRIYFEMLFSSDCLKSVGGLGNTKPVLWKRSFHMTCFSANVMLFPPTSLWQFIIYEPIIYGQERLTASLAEVSCLRLSWLGCVTFYLWDVRVYVFTDYYVYKAFWMLNMRRQNLAMPSHSCLPLPQLHKCYHFQCYSLGYCSRNAVTARISDWAPGQKAEPNQGSSGACSEPDWKGWSQDPSLSRPCCRVGSGGKGILLEITAYLWPSKGKQLFSFVSVSMAVAFGLVCICYSQRLCHSAIITVLSITL